MNNKNLNRYRVLVFTLAFLFSIKGYSSVFLGAIPFITTWQTDILGRSNNKSIIIPVHPDEVYNYTVDWGDGTPPTTETGEATHTYAVAGVYTVSITGVFPRIYFNQYVSHPLAEDNNKLLTIEQWGDNPWTSMEGAFSGCSNLQGNFTDAPDLSNVSSLSQMFGKAISFNHDISNWDVSNITDMSSLFDDAKSFNQDIGGWNVSNVTNMTKMFGGASNLYTMSFNQNIGNWDVSNVTNMSFMFWRTKSFNQDIGNWDVSNVTLMNSMFSEASLFNQDISNWNVSNVTHMGSMFSRALAFNQDIGHWDVANVNSMGGMFAGTLAFNQDIGNWNVGNVTNMGYMFDGALAFNQDLSNWNVSSVTDMRSMFSDSIVFDQDIGNWDVSKVTDMREMFSGVTLSIENYDALLLGWEALNLQPNVIFDGGDSRSCTGGVAIETIIDDYNWTIIDKGISPHLIVDLPNQTVSESYTLPIITGERFSGNEAYYTETNGAGISFNAGDIINYSDFPSYPITLYMFGGSNESCSSEQNFQLTITSVPFCTNLSIPMAGETNVPVGTDLAWLAISGATGYKLTVGTSPGSGDILNNLDLGYATSYNLDDNLPGNTTIYVRVIPYNLDGEAEFCVEEQFTTGEALVPNCTDLLTPLSGSINVSVDTDLSWTPIANALSYRLMVGTSSGGNDIVDHLDVGNVSSYDLPTNLPGNTVIYVNITPYNLDGDAYMCVEKSFITADPILVPECTVLLRPLSGDTQVAVDTGLTWGAVPNATGYMLTLETFTDGIDVLNKFDVGNTTSYLVPGKLLENTRYYVIIQPYNSAGEATDCPEVIFSTGEDTTHYPPNFFTPNNDGINDYWVVPNVLNRVKRVYIYNRHGKLLNEIVDLSTGWDGKFKNEFMPTDDYWFLITYLDGKVLKGHFSLVR